MLDRLVSTRDALASLRWRPSRTLAFVVDQPKRREIHAATFADRVVHHLLVERLARLYEPIFIHDFYANRRGKGTHAAVARLHAFMRSATQGGRLPAYALQLDIANYFNSIHRPTLFRLLQGRLLRAVRRQGLDRDEARALQAHCRALLSADPTAGVRRQGPPARHARIPPHKRLGGLGPGYGLPIGNLTSQFFANVYLNELDQFVKHQLKARWYLRYVDDLVLVHPDPAQLLAWRERIVDFLAARLQLRLKELAEPRRLTQGIDFLGYVVRPSHRVVRRRVIRHFHARLADFERAHVRPNALRLPPAARDRLRAQVASFLGHCRHASAARLWRGTLTRFPWLAAVFDRPEDATRGHPLRPAWTAASVTGLAGQYRALARRCPEARLLMQVGNRWLLTAPRAAGASRVRRPGLGACLEVDPRDLPTLRARLKRAGQAHALATQTGHYRTGFKRRELVLRWRPATATASSFLAPSAGVTP